MPNMKSIPQDGAARIRMMQQMRAGGPAGYAPGTPDIEVAPLDLSPHELDMTSQSPIPSQDQLDGITKQMQGYSYNPAAPMRDPEDGAMTWKPQYAKIPGYKMR